MIRDSRGRFARRAPGRFDMKRFDSFVPVHSFLVSADGRWRRTVDPLTGRPVGPWERTCRDRERFPPFSAPRGGIRFVKPPSLSP